MFDLHSHILPGVDDGAATPEISLEMAASYVAQGVTTVVCTPHILPGVYPNTGSRIREAVAELQAFLQSRGSPLSVRAGADNHVVPDFVQGLRQGHLLTLADTRYVLVEPPHHVAPARLEDLFFNILMAGYVPILTHPERLTWIETKYDMMGRLVSSGAWMQITSGSLTGRFGKRARHWAERMLADELVHIIASDAHNLHARPPDLLEGFRAAERLVGAIEAQHLVVTRPMGILSDMLPRDLPVPQRASPDTGLREHNAAPQVSRAGDHRSFADRVRRIFS